MAAFATRYRGAGGVEGVLGGMGDASLSPRTAVEELAAQRIGHGTTLLDDPDVADLVRRRGVVIEACVTSNLHTGVIRRIEDHPLPRWLELGVRACVCTDNTRFSVVDAVEEHARARSIPGMTPGSGERVRARGGVLGCTLYTVDTVSRGARAPRAKARAGRPGAGGGRPPTRPWRGAGEERSGACEVRALRALPGQKEDP